MRICSSNKKTNTHSSDLYISLYVNSISRGKNKEPNKYGTLLNKMCTCLQFTLKCTKNKMEKGMDRYVRRSHKMFIVESKWLIDEFVL